MPRPKKNKPKEVKVDGTKPYITITLTMGDKVLKGEGATFAEAFDSLPRPFKIVSKGVLRVTSNAGEKVLPLQPAGVKQLFFPISRHVVIKKLSFGL